MYTDTKNVDSIFELIELVFMANKDGKVDKEEALLMIQALFSENIDDFSLNCIRYICLHRDMDEFHKVWGSEPVPAGVSSWRQLLPP
jgi:hypothetical protein